jgi:hypothetical protein
METVAANEKPEEQKMNRRPLAPLALLAIGADIAMTRAPHQGERR